MEFGVTYIPEHLPEHIEKDMQCLKDMGCTEVLFALQENNFLYLTGPLRFGAALAKENGLTPYAVIWGFANTFGGGRISRIMLDNPGLWQLNEAGNPGPFACINNPVLTVEFVKLAVQSFNYGYEGIFIDEPTLQECFCSHCQESFYGMFGKDLKESVGTEEYLFFQKETVKKYVRKACAEIKRFDNRKKTMVCIMPHNRDLFKHMAEIPDLDVLGTDPYWLLPPLKMTVEDAVKCTQELKQVCVEHGKISQVWLNCWGIPAGREEEIYTGGRMLADVGCDSFYTWAYRGALGVNEECANPEKSWENAVKLYREIACG